MARITLALYPAVSLFILFFISAKARNSTSSGTDDSDLKELCFRVRSCVKSLDRGEPCPILPIPKSAFLPFVAPGSYTLTPLRTGVWLYFDGVYQAVLMKIDRHLAVIDFPAGSVPALKAATMEILDGSIPKRVDMVYSHAHFDHIAGAKEYYEFLRSDFPGLYIQIWGSYETRREIRASDRMPAVIPNVIVRSRGRTLSVGPDLDVNMFPIGGHIQQDLLLHIPRRNKESSILMVVDIVYPGWAPFLNLASTTSVRKYIAAHEKILEFDFDIFLAGHVNTGNVKDVKRNLRFARDIVRIGGMAVKNVQPSDLVEAGIGKVGDPSAPEFGNIWWASVEVSLKLQIDYCYRRMLAKYGCTLAGLDVMLRSHCYTAVGYNIVSL